MDSSILQKQERVLFELRLILLTCQSIDSNIIESIDLIANGSLLTPYNTVVQENIDTLKQILQLLESL